MFIRFVLLMLGLLACALPAAALENDRLFTVAKLQAVPSGRTAPSALKLPNGKVLVLWGEVDPAAGKPSAPVYRIVGRIYDPSRSVFSVKRTYVGQRVRNGRTSSPTGNAATSAATVLADGRIVVCWLQDSPPVESGGGYCTTVSAGGRLGRESSFRDLGIADAGGLSDLSNPGRLGLFVLPESGDVLLLHQGGCPAAKMSTAVCASRFDATMTSKRYTRVIVDRSVIPSTRHYAAALLPDGRIALAYNWQPIAGTYQRALRVFDPATHALAWERAIGGRETYASPFEVAATPTGIVVAYPASKAPFPIKRILVESLSFAGLPAAAVTKVDGKDNFSRGLTGLSDGTVLLASSYNLLTRLAMPTTAGTVNYAGGVRSLLRPPSVVQIDDRFALAAFDMSDGTGNYAVLARLVRLDR